MKNIPPKIYLQVDADGETPEDFKHLEVTWADERIYKTDLCYGFLEQDDMPYYMVRKGDKVNCILSAALRELNAEQLILLRDAIIERTPHNNS
jgi:hypothetical protein